MLLIRKNIVNMHELGILLEFHKLEILIIQ